MAWTYVDDDCNCQNVFVSATKVLSDKQGKVLCKYGRGPSSANGRPYFVKKVDAKAFYLKFDDDGEQCQLWTNSFLFFRA